MSLSSDLLSVLVAVQALFVGALFLVLLLNRLFHDIVSRRRERWVERTERAVLGFLAGRREASELAGVLGSAPLASVREALEATWDEIVDEDRLRLRRIARSSGLDRRLGRRSRSLLWWRRMDAAQVLAFVGSPEDTDTLVRLLEDRHMAVRVASTFAARDLSLPSLLEPLLRQLLRADPPRRRALYDAILSFGRDAVPEVLRALEDTEREDTARQAVLLTLAGRIADRAEATELLPAVVRRADHEDRELRIQAMKALVSFPDAQVIGLLRQGLDDPAWEVRAQAAKGLGQQGVVAARHELRSALSDGSWWVRLRAAVALRVLGLAGLRMLRAIDAEEDPYAHDMAVYVLRLEEAALTDYAA